MANVRIQLNNKPYTIECGDGQEERIQWLSNYVDEKLSTLKNNGAAMAEDQLFAITSLILADEIQDLKEKISQTDMSHYEQSDNMIAENDFRTVLDEVNARIKAITEEVEAL